MTKVEELRRAFGADDYSTLARIVGGLVWERDAGKWRQETPAARIRNIGRLIC